MNYDIIIIIPFCSVACSGILAGTDTTATALTCLLLLFVHHPHIQISLWEEISATIGNERLPCLADREKLPYMEATLLELLR